MSLIMFAGAGEPPPPVPPDIFSYEARDLTPFDMDSQDESPIDIVSADVTPLVVASS